MKRLLLFLLALVLGASAAPARDVFPAIDGPIIVAQGMGFGFDATLQAIGACGGWGNNVAGGGDGCEGAPTANAYTVQHANFFSGYAQQDGQTYATTGGCAPTAGFPSGTACHPPWAVSGVDYPVGPNASAVAAFATPGGVSDPTISANTPSGCAIQTGTGTPGSGISHAFITLSCSTNPSGTDAECQKYYPDASQCLDVGPFDFSPSGNSSGVGVNFGIGTGVTVPCVVHDNNFMWDIATSYNGTGIEAFGIQGCSAITHINNVYHVMDSATGLTNAWDPVSPGAYVAAYLSENVNNATEAELNRPFVNEYNAFIDCPARCFSTGSMVSKYNYYEGLNMYTATHGNGAYHGDGFIPTWYDEVCECSGNNGMLEQFDTWLLTSTGYAQDTCISCGVIVLPNSTWGGQMNKGSAVMVADSSIIAGAQAGPQIGDRVTESIGGFNYGADTYLPPYPTPFVSSCPGDTSQWTGPGLDPNCNGALGDYNLTLPWTVTPTWGATNGAYVYAANLPGCSSGLTNCPTITSATGAVQSFTISTPASGPIAEESMPEFAPKVTGITGTISGSTLTTSASVTLTAGYYIYDPNLSGCASTPTLCPTIAATATGTSFTLNSSPGNVTNDAMGEYQLVTTFAGQIFAGALSTVEFISGGGTYSPSNIATMTLDRNVYVTNFTTSGSPSGAGSDVVSGAGGVFGTTARATNNYYDACGVGSNTGQTTANCDLNTNTAHNLLGTTTDVANGSSNNGGSYQEGNNIQMNTGTCASVYGSPASCGVYTTNYLPQAYFSPLASDTNATVDAIALKPNGTPSITQGAHSTTVGGAVSLSAAPTLKDALIVDVRVNNGSTTAPLNAACTDNQGTHNTFNLEVSDVLGGPQDLWSYVFVAPLAHVGAGFTVTCSVTGAVSQTTVVEEATGVSTGSGTTDPTDGLGGVYFGNPTAGSNSLVTGAWGQLGFTDLIWAAYLGSASSMGVGTVPMAFTAGPSGDQGSGLFTEWTASETTSTTTSP